MHHCQSGFKSFLLLVGRICFSLIFIIAGIGKIMAFTSTAAMMTSKGLPYADVLLIVAIVFELGGGLLVFFGWYTRFGALLLLLFLIPVTYLFHAYWAMEGATMVNNMQHFLKNLALVGGSLYIIAVGAGSVSLDRLRCKKKCHGESEGSS